MISDMLEEVVISKQVSAVALCHAHSVVHKGGRSVWLTGDGRYIIRTAFDSICDGQHAVLKYFEVKSVCVREREREREKEKVWDKVSESCR